MERRNFIIGAASLATATTIGSVAVTSATVERDVNIAVASDDQALIGLIPGDTSAAELVNGDQLEIDVSTDQSSGLNTNALFEYGDPSDPVSTNLFSLVNNDDDTQEFTVSFAPTEGGNDGAVTFTLYDDGGDQVGDVTETQDQTFELDSAEQYYVVMVVDTDGTADGDDLGGELTFSI